MWLPELFLTCLLEFPVYAFFLRNRESLKRTLLFVFLLNGFTHPLAAWFFHEGGWNFYAIEALVWIAESAAVLVFLPQKEILFFRNLLSALLIAFLANLSSAGAGKFIGWMQGLL